MSTVSHFEATKRNGGSLAKTTQHRCAKTPRAPTPAQPASVVFPVILRPFGVPGGPGGSIIAMVPVLAAVNLPIDGIGILLAVDTIPDMFRTTANVTGSLALAAVIRKAS